jgi:DNA-binding MarR family transcriptional regulator
MANMLAREIAELLLLAGRLVQTEGYDGKLSPAQWMALRFFARANSFSRTPSALAQFQATTRGTASQAIKALEAGGYLARQRSRADGRSVTLRLTNKGNKAIARDPFEALVRAVGSLNAQVQSAMHDALRQVLTAVVASGAHRHFGICQDCAYLAGETSRSSTGATGSASQCLLFSAPIEPEDARLLCVHFQPMGRTSGGRRE